MARELRVAHNAIATIYAIIRRTTDDNVWNGTAFVAWSDANLPSYALALTARGGDVYTGDFPAGIEAGLYAVYYYVQSGPTPTTTDGFLGGREMYWNGGAVTETPGTYLTTLEKVKRYAGIATNVYDNRLNDLLAAASRYVQQYCHSSIMADDFVERRNGYGNGYLTLSNVPVVRIYRISSGIATALSVTRTGNADTAFARISDGDIVLTWTLAGTTSTATIGLGTYATVADLAAAINALSGWSASVAGGLGARSPADLIPTAGLSAIQAAVPFEMGLFNLDIARYNPETGTIHGRFPAGYRNIEVRYRAGYDVVPDDVQIATAMVAKSMLDMSKRDTSLVSERIGDYAWSAGSGSAPFRVEKTLSREAGILLEPYRHLVFA